MPARNSRSSRSSTRGRYAGWLVIRQILGPRQKKERAFRAGCAGVAARRPRAERALLLVGGDFVDRLLRVVQRRSLLQMTTMKSVRCSGRVQPFRAKEQRGDLPNRNSLPALLPAQGVFASRRI